MLTYILKRLVLLVIVVLGVTMATFILMNAAPGDPAEMVAIARYGLENLTAVEIENIRMSEGLDAPIWIQYLHWLAYIKCAQANGIYFAPLFFCYATGFICFQQHCFFSR